MTSVPKRPAIDHAVLCLLQVAGCGLLGFGVYTHTSSEGVTKIAAILGASLFSTFTIALMICGGVVVVVSFLGCCGAIKEVRCMLGTVGHVIFSEFIFPRQSFNFLCWYERSRDL